VFQFLSRLKEQGHKWSLIEAPQRNFARRLAYVPRLFSIALTHDVLFVQKRTLPLSVLAILKKLNPHIVFDLDDAIYLRPSRKPLVDAMLRASALIIAGNESLAAYSRQFNDQVKLIPTVVDTNLYQPLSSARHPGDDRVVIGWIGSDPNRGDFTSMQPVLEWLYNRYGDHVTMRIVGSRPLEIKTKMNLEFIPWTLAKSRAKLQEFDIGIMPLEDTEWNRGKCGLKLIEYMAVEAATVASPVGVNRQIVIDDETGFLATTTEEWKNGLAQLIDDQSLRLQMGRLGRKHIVQQYSVESVLPLLIDALQAGAAIE
jgi:glycosyltransferase involved in cell wall biosynthesis